MERTFSTTELAKVLGKDTRFCISWTELGIFLADIQPAAGYASRRKFSYLGLLRAYLAIYFHETYGFQRKKIKDLMEILWRDNFFYQWKIGFPNAVKMLNKMAATISLNKSRRVAACLSRILMERVHVYRRPQCLLQTHCERCRKNRS